MRQAQSAGDKANGAGRGQAVAEKRRYARPETTIRTGKTEQGYTSRLRKAVIDEESRYRNASREHASIIDADGNVRFGKWGNKGSVTFTYGEVMKMKDMILTHNHPNESKSHWWGAVGGPFSEADIRMAVRGNLAEIRAVTPTYTFSLKRPKGGWGELWRVEARYKALQTKYTREQNKYVGEGKDYTARSQRHDRANLAKWHQIVRDLSKEFGWEYTKKKG